MAIPNNITSSKRKNSIEAVKPIIINSISPKICRGSISSYFIDMNIKLHNAYRNVMAPSLNLVGLGFCNTYTNAAPICIMATMNKNGFSFM